MLENFLSPNASFVRPYGVAHIIYLFACFSIIFLFIKNKESVIKNRRLYRIIFLVVLSIQQVFFLYGWYAFCTPNFWAEGLPLQLCRVSSLLTIVFLINEKKSVVDVLNYFSVFALISFFYPMNVYNFGHISGFSYMINHLITVLIPIFTVIAYDWEPSKKSCISAICSFTVYFVLALIANEITGGNYFYQTDRPFLSGLSSLSFAALSFVVTCGGFVVLTLVVSKLFSLVKKKNK